MECRASRVAAEVLAAWGAQGQGAELVGNRGDGGRRGARGAEADALPGLQRDVGDGHMAVGGALGQPDDAQLDAEPVDDQGVADTYALVGEFGGHHDAVRLPVREAVAVGDRGVEEGAGLDAEGGEVDLGAAVRRAAGDGDTQRGRVGVRVRAPGGGGLLVEETAGELVGPGVRGEDQLRGREAAQRGDGVVTQAGGEAGDDADECGDEHHDGPHEQKAPSGGAQLQQSEEHGGSLRWIDVRDGASPT